MCWATAARASIKQAGPTCGCAICSSPETSVAFVLLFRGLPSYQVFQFGKLCNTHTFSVVLLCGCSDSSYNIPALIRRVPAKQPLSRSAAVSFGVNAPIKSSSLTRCATHIHCMTCHSVEVQTVPSNDGPQSEGAYEAVSFWICGRLFGVCSLFNRRRFRSYLPLWPSLVMFIPNLLLSLLVRVRLKRACLIEIPGA